MAEPFDSLAASIADVIDRLAKGEITEAQAAALLAPLLALVSDGEYGAKVEQVVGVLGRVSGMIIVQVTPPATRPSNLIGAPGGFAWDPSAKVFYGPKDAVTGWPAGVSMTQGPAGPSVQMQVSATHIQWRVVGTSTWNNLIALSALKGADGQQVSLQKSATHIQWRLGTGAWADLIPVADLKGDRGEQGIQGPKGDTGGAGPKGDTGDTGPKGDKGDTGDQGPKGDQGDIGPKGDTGERGLLGETGPKGDTGDIGPKGDKGDQGIQGPKGDKGDRGDAFAVNAQGDLAGRDAYDAEPVGFSYLDVENGNLYFRVAPSGWSTPIPFGKGDKGDKGDPGAKGDPGEPGVKGDKGDPGEEGPQGPKGDPGAPGADGSDATVTEQAVKAALGFTPADAADTYTKDEVDEAFDALPDPPAVPTFATVAEVRAGNVDGKIISPKVMAEALATVVIARTDAASGINFSTFINAQIVLDANGTLGPPSGGYPGQTGLINVSNATGSATLAFASAYRMPKGGITIEAGVNASTRIPYMIGGAGAVILFPASKWSA